MPFLVASLMSTLSRPTPHLAITFKFFATSITSLSIEEALLINTRSASTTSLRSLSLLLSSVDMSTQLPILVNCSNAVVSSLSQIKIFI